jgi:hypothetical protein
VVLWDTFLVRLFEITFIDGSRDLINADYHDRVGGVEHFVRFTGPSGEERWAAVEAVRIESIVELSADER